MGQTRFLAWDEATGQTVAISRQQMIDSLMAQAAALGRGTPACAVLEMQAAEVARGGTAGYMTEAQLDAMTAGQ